MNERAGGGRQWEQWEQREPLLYPRSEWNGQRVRVTEPNLPPYLGVVVGVIRDGRILDPHALVRALDTARERAVRIAHLALLH